MVQGGGKFTPG